MLTTVQLCYKVKTGGGRRAKMTLVACLKGRDGLILAADSRGTIGDPRGLTAINDSQLKLFNLSEFVGIVCYGQAELAAQLISEVKRELSAEHIHFSSLFQKTRECIGSKYFEWFKNLPRDQRPVVGFIIGGLESNGGANIYYLSSPLDFAPQLCTTGFALGGIPQYATYLVRRLYDSQMSIKNLQQLAAYIISETATQDPKVGGPIRMAEISTQEGYKELDQARIAELVRHNEQLSSELRRFFFPKEEPHD